VNEGTWIITIGLVFDMIGVILILSPLLHLVKANHPKGDPNPEKNEFTGGIVDLKHHYEQDKKAQRNAWVGLGFLVFGFALQIFGNWILNPPF